MIESFNMSAVGFCQYVSKVSGDVLAALTLPYDREWGDVMHQNWASIHSSPPWRETNTPAIVENRFGDGLVIYSAADIGSISCPANEAVMLRILDRLDSSPSSYSTDAHASVWMNVEHQVDKRCYIIKFLNCQKQYPPIPIGDFTFTLRIPEEKDNLRVSMMPGNESVDWSVNDDGGLCVKIDGLDEFLLLKAMY